LQGTYLYTVEDESHQIYPGTFFWFDNKRVHESYNNGDVDRLTFVWDVPKSRKNP
jgi:quercetin dioxygenase-like cupin family protein